jgi:flagellar protein FlaJ
MNEAILVVFASLCILSLGVIYRRHLIKKDIVDNFPRFFQELHNNCASGMTLVAAVRQCKNADYGRLTPLIKNLCLQIEWGVPFPAALRNFGKKIDDDYITGIVNLVEKAASFSPNVGQSMDEIYRHIALTRALEKERSAALFPQLISTYLIFFVLLGTIYMIFRFFLPSFGGGNIGLFKGLFSHLVIIESLLAGLAVGKIVDGSFKAGIKHALVLLCIGICFIYFYNI